MLCEGTHGKYRPQTFSGAVFVFALPDGLCYNEDIFSRDKVIKWKVKWNFSKCFTWNICSEIFLNMMKRWLQ